MKNLCDNIIRPSVEADNVNGRINRKLIKNIFFIDIDRPKKLNGFTPFMFSEMAKAFTEYELVLESEGGSELSRSHTARVYFSV